MRTCNCTLPYTNPEACKTCPNGTYDYGEYPWGDYPTIVPMIQPKTRNVKRKTKTIEKYGPNGEYLGKEIIIEDIEDIEDQVYTGTIIGNGTSNYNMSSGDNTWDISNDPNVQISYSNTGSRSVIDFCTN